MKEDEAMQRSQVPQQNHGHCRFVEAETQRPLLHGSLAFLWIHSVRMSIVEKLIGEQHQWENQYPLRIQTVAKQSEIQHHFADDAPQQAQQKTPTKSQKWQRPRCELDQLVLPQKLEKYFKMTELISRIYNNAPKIWIKRPNCPHNFQKEFWLKICWRNVRWGDLEEFEGSNCMTITNR